MSVVTQTFAAGDEDYIDKLNLLHEAIVELQLSGDGGLSPASFLAMSIGLFGADNVCRIGSDSYIASTDGTVLTISAGEAYLPDDQTFVQDVDDTDIDFNGLGAGTYYVHIDPSTGEPEADLLSVEDYIYEVVWSGTEFTSVTDTGEEVPGFTDWGGLGSGALWSTTYTIPQRIDAVERMAALMLEVEITGSTYTLVEDEALQQDTLRFYGTPGATCTVTLPDKTRSYFAFNKTDSNLVFTAGAGTTVTVPAACMGIFYTDSLTNVVGVLVIAMSGDEFVGGGGGGGGTASTTVHHPVNVFVGGKTGDAAILLRTVFSYTVTMLAGMSGSYVRASTAATAETVFTLKKVDYLASETEIGTVTFAAGATTGVISFPADVTFTEGLEFLVIEGPATEDATLQNISFALRAYKPATLSYTVAAFLPTLLGAGQYLFYGTPTHTFTLPASAAHCYGVAAVAPSDGDATLSLKKNGTQFGSVVFLSGATTATVTIASDTEIAEGVDIISIEGPSPSDSTLSGVSVTLRGVRSG